MQNNILIFIDEFGNPHLDLGKSGTFSHYIYTAIVFKGVDEDKIRQSLDVVRKKFFQGSPIKSNHIGNDSKGVTKRLNVIKEFKKNDFIIVSLVIDKSEVEGKGLKYKKVFYKYFQRIFVEKFAENFTSFQIFADKVGNEHFQRELKEYVNKKTQRDLFNPNRYFTLAEDKVEEPLIQIADFFSGCIGKIYCISHQQENFGELFDLLSDRLFVDFFPFSENTFLATVDDNANQSESKIAKIAVKEIITFIDVNSENAKMVECLEIAKYLLLMFKSNPNKLVSTKELISVVKRKTQKYSQENLRQNIAQMRDKGIIIASPQGKYGYKIPNNANDMVGFYNRYFSSIKPMLRRIQMSNEKIALQTVNEVNVLKNTPEFEIIQELIDVVKKQSIKK